MSFTTSVLLANFTVLQRVRPVLGLLARSEGDIYLNILIEFSEDRNHPVEREAAKLCVADMREFRVRNSRLLLSVAGRKLAIIKDIDDFRRDNGAGLL